MDHNETHMSFYFMARVLDYRTRVVEKALKWQNPKLMDAAINGEYQSMRHIIEERVDAVSFKMHEMARAIGNADYAADHARFMVVAAQMARVSRRHRKLVKLCDLYEVAEKMFFEHQDRDADHPMNLPLPELMAEVARLREQTLERVHG